MTPHVLPLCWPQVNWLPFIQEIHEVLGINVDIGKLVAGSDSALLVAFKTVFDRQNLKPNRAMRESGGLCDHLFYVFALHCDYTLKHRILECTNLRVDSTQTNQKTTLQIVSGTLTQWVRAIVALCRDSEDYNTRMVFGAILISFEGSGLKMWQRYRKYKHEDGSMILKEK